MAVCAPGRDSREAVRIFVLDKLEQPRGSFGLGWDKDFSRKLWIIGLELGLGLLRCVW